MAVTVTLFLPAAAAAHPLGNFTTNQFLGLFLTPDSVLVDYVLDLAEVPTSQQRRQIDADRDEQVSAAESARFESETCAMIAGRLQLVLDGDRLALALEATDLSFPPGEASLPTLRLECRYRAGMRLEGASTLQISNGNFADRIGWKEMIAGSEDLALNGTLPSASATRRLRDYPRDLLSSPIEVQSATLQLAISAGTTIGAPPPPVGSGAEGSTPVDRLASLIDPASGAPALPLAMGAAVGLGVIHALAPGHGKTVMAAYLVGSKGTARQAMGLGLAVAASHTVGVLALGGLTLAGTAAFAPETVFPILSRISGVIIIGIGLWLLWRWFSSRRHLHDHQPDDHQHHHHRIEGAEAGRQGWKVLASMGLAGGLVPSTSAVVLLLAAVNLGRIPAGLLLIALFGLGMAATLVGVGFTMVKASSLGLERWGATGLIGRLRSVLTPLAGLVVIAVGLFLTFRPA
jgi:ABC-type nickel/cobalt efflux system permease component RcnA